MVGEPPLLVEVDHIAPRRPLQGSMVHEEVVELVELVHPVEQRALLPAWNFRCGRSQPWSRMALNLSLAEWLFCVSSNLQARLKSPPMTKARFADTPVTASRMICVFREPVSFGRGLRPSGRLCTSDSWSAVGVPVRVCTLTTTSGSGVRPATWVITAWPSSADARSGSGSSRVTAPRRAYTTV